MTGPKRQHSAPQPATLTFDLEFDTAEMTGNASPEGDPRKIPKDVRELTAELRKFVHPAGNNKTGPPPRILFQWGPLHFPGIVTSLTEDLDYFAPDRHAAAGQAQHYHHRAEPEVRGQRDGPGAVPFTMHQTRRAPARVTPGTQGTGSPTSAVPPTPVRACNSCWPAPGRTRPPGAPR